MKAAVETKRATKEALDRTREKLKLEMRQQWDRYDQERVLELEREDRAILDAEEKVRGLEDVYLKYKNQEAAAEVRLHEHSNQHSDDADAPPSATAGPPGNPRGSDGPTGNGRRSGNETRSLRTASVHGVTLGSGV